MSKKRLRKILVLEVVVATLALVFVMVVLWNKPLGPVLGMATPAAAQAGSDSGQPASTPDNPAAIPAPTDTPSSLLSRIIGILKPPVPTAEPLCGGPSVMTLLLIGSDERSDDYLYGLADSIRLVRIDFTTPQVMMVDIPRDFWVEIPDIADHYGVTHGKLNQAYFFGNPGMGYYDGPGEGPGLLARTLQKNFGVTVDHYFAVNMDTFVRMIDSIDGIDININSKIDLNVNPDEPNPDYVFEPGTHHLDGTLALKLAMNRNPTIFQRARYQTLVLRAIQDKLLSASMLSRWPELITQFTKAVQTDLSANDISKLVCISQKLTDDKTTTVAFPEEMFSSGDVYDPYREVNTWILEADFNQVRSYLADFMNGVWP